MKLKSTKDLAIELRKKGFSYGMISEQTGLSKSTLSNWLKEIPFNPNAELIERVNSAKLKSAKFKNDKRLENMHKMKLMAKSELDMLSKRDLWFVGIGIYLGEGSKQNETIRIVNSDPNIIKIMVRWFLECCNLEMDNFAPSVHLYPDSNINDSIDYWSKITGINKNQFRNPQIDKRIDKVAKKRNKLLFGTLHLQIVSNGNKEHGRSLHRRIIGWIESIHNQILRV